MGQLAITIGPISASVQFDNARGAEVIKRYLRAYQVSISAGEGAETLTVDNMTNQQVADAFVAHLTNHIKEAAQGYSRRKAEEDARVAAEAAEAENDWN